MVDTLHFEQPLVLLGGGDCDTELLQRLLARDWPLVAADGGANRLADTGIIPEAIIGDLDSLQDKQYWMSCSRVIQVTEQDTTDFEKCLYSTEAPVFIAMGFTGKRFDHTLAALNALLRYVDSKNVILISESDVIIVRRGKYTVSLPVGCRFSIFPLTRVEFSASNGLYYPLDGLVLQQGEMIGCSNRVAGEAVELLPSDSGAYSVIVPLSCLDTLIGETAL